MRKININRKRAGTISQESTTISPSFFLCLIFFTVLVFLLSSQQLFPDKVLDADVPRQVQPGNVLTIRLGEEWSKTYPRIRALLLDESGKTLTEGKSFQLEAGRNGSRFILLGVPNTLSSGTYHVRFLSEKAERGEEHYLASEEVEVVPRRFESEKIPLRKKLTALRKEPNPQKREEAVEIHEIYGSFHSEAVYEAGIWEVPVQYTRVSSNYGDRRTYSYSDGGTSKWIHTGVDLSSPEGTPVKAAGSGKVLLAEERIISGWSVVIEHLPGVYSVYFHLESMDVEAGQVVEKGRQIGTVGMTGLATGPHLHWEVRVQGVPVDPWGLTKEGILENMGGTEGSVQSKHTSEGG